jgi:hypothetical protein
MGYWAWFWIWTGLIAGSLAVFAYLFWDLYTKSVPIIDQIKIGAERAKPLLEALEKASEYEPTQSAILAEPEEVFAQRADVVRNKEERIKARQRRLIESLKDIDVNESRFTNAP